MENAPFFTDIAQGPVNGAAHWVTASDGLRIRVGHWTAADLKGTVILFPGRTEYIEKYGPAAAEFMSRGYATLAIDWRGQGLSDRTGTNREYGDVAKFKDYQHDVKAAMKHARALGLPKPYFLVGHSMGGCIGLRALYNNIDVNAAVFSAPMWGVLMSPILRPIAWALSSVARKTGMDQLLSPGQNAKSYVTREEFSQNTLTGDPEMFSMMQMQLRAQPVLGLGGPTLRWLNEALREIRDLSKKPSPKTECCTFLGTKESIVDPAAIRDRMAQWPNGQLHVFEGGQHEIMMEIPKMRTDFYDKSTAFFQLNG